MAIVMMPMEDEIGGGGGGAALERVIRIARPAIEISDGKLVLDSDIGEWSEVLRTRRDVIERAARGVARIHTTDAAFPWVGTAFAISRRTAITADFNADLIASKLRDGSGQAATGASLNFDPDSTSAFSVRISGVRKVHPYWGFSFLDLDDDIEANRILPIASKIPESDLINIKVCVIGFPAADVRNDPEAMLRIFNGKFNIMRAMPGKLLSYSRESNNEDSLSLVHDASTTGGTAGAPLIDLATGAVVGIHRNGKHLEANYAAPAWEVSRDPQWWRGAAATPLDTHLVSSGGTERLEIGLVRGKPRLLKFAEIENLHSSLMTLVRTEARQIGLLFLGLPQGYVATLPSEGSPSERLYAMLHAVNDGGERIENHSPFYYILKNAMRLKDWDTAWKAEMQKNLLIIEDREKASD